MCISVFQVLKFGNIGIIMRGYVRDNQKIVFLISLGIIILRW